MTTTRAPPIDDAAASVLVERDRLVLTVAEAAEALGISRAFAYELPARGELPVIRLGRRRLVPKRALLALVGAGEEAAAQPVTPAPLYCLVAEPQPVK